MKTMTWHPKIPLKYLRYLKYNAPFAFGCGGGNSEEDYAMHKKTKLKFHYVYQKMTDVVLTSTSNRRLKTH